jgi:hypothetical protein
MTARIRIGSVLHQIFIEPVDFRFPPEDLRAYGEEFEGEPCQTNAD